MVQASIGTRVPRLDGREKAMGASQYLADLKLPGMMQVRFVKSPLAHARIKSIDTSAAEALPGVAGVVTHADVPDTRVGRSRDGPEAVREREGPVCRRYCGAAVAAERPGNGQAGRRVGPSRI